MVKKLWTSTKGLYNIKSFILCYSLEEKYIEQLFLNI